MKSNATTDADAAAARTQRLTHAFAVHLREFDWRPGKRHEYWPGIEPAPRSPDVLTRSTSAVGDFGLFDPAPQWVLLP